MPTITSLTCPSLNRLRNRIRAAGLVSPGCSWKSEQDSSDYSDPIITSPRWITITATDSRLLLTRAASVLEWRVVVVLTQKESRKMGEKTVCRGQWMDNEPHFQVLN